DFLDRTVTSVLAPDGGGRWIEYAGGYSDMLAQRGGARLDERKVRARAATQTSEDVEKPAAEPSRTTAKKLSYKQKVALESLQKKMQEAADRIASLEKKLTDPALFSKDPAAFNKTATELEKQRVALTSMEEEWLELEMLREEIEG